MAWDVPRLWDLQRGVVLLQEEVELLGYHVLWWRITAVFHPYVSIEGQPDLSFEDLHHKVLGQESIADRKGHPPAIPPETTLQVSLGADTDLSLSLRGFASLHLGDFFCGKFKLINLARINLIGFGYVLAPIRIAISDCAPSTVIF